MIQQAANPTTEAANPGSGNEETAEEREYRLMY